jgi:hypothetical protein
MHWQEPKPRSKAIGVFFKLTLAIFFQSLHFPKRIASVENALPDAAFRASASSPVMDLFPENLSAPMSSMRSTPLTSLP